MTVPHYGKREPGSLTAASPGDTLYFNFGSYNDSGDSEALVGLAVTDIEVFKNGAPTARATDSGYSLISDTGQVGDRLGLHRFSIQLFNTADDATFYATGSWYQVAVDSVTVDGKTVRFWAGSFEIGRDRVDVRELIGDTGAANWLKQQFASGFADTGLNDRLARILSDTDTGIQSSVNVTTLADTGVNERLARIQSDVDTGLRVHIDDSDTGVKDTIADLDTGLRAILQTTGVNVASLRGDTGAANWLKTSFLAGFADTGLYSRIDKLAEDTGGVNINSIQGDTGAAGWLKAAFASGFADTGINDRLARILADTDTGIQSSVNVTTFADTGVNNRLAVIAADTDTGIQSSVTATNVTGFADTGVNERLAAIEAKTDKLTFDTGNELQTDIRKVNNVTVGGTGANGDEWRPA